MPRPIAVARDLTKQGSLEHWDLAGRIKIARKAFPQPVLFRCPPRPPLCIGIHEMRCRGTVFMPRQYALQLDERSVPQKHFHDVFFPCTSSSSKSQPIFPIWKPTVSLLMFRMLSRHQFPARCLLCRPPGALACCGRRGAYSSPTPCMAMDGLLEEVSSGRQLSDAAWYLCSSVDAVAVSFTSAGARREHRRVHRYEHRRHRCIGFPDAI
jgi:hypothetical protein